MLSLCDGEVALNRLSSSLTLGAPRLHQKPGLHFMSGDGHTSALERDVKEQALHSLTAHKFPAEAGVTGQMPPLSSVPTRE